MAPTFFTFLPLLVPLLSSVALSQEIAPRVVYANDFIDPDFILAGNFGPYTQRAQASIISWAEASALDGPWSTLATKDQKILHTHRQFGLIGVMNKTIEPPSGDRHDYLSWAP